MAAPRTARRVSYRRFERFVRDYTSGMEPDDFRHLYRNDARRVFDVLMRDRERAGPEKRGLRRLLFNARLLFLSLSEKLSPRRRLVFALSLLIAFLGLVGLDFTYNSADYGFQIDASPIAYLLSIGGLLFLLSAELVDRVLVRDEVEVARQLQGELLPKSMPEIPGWSFASSWRTANDIGGDYYRFQRVGGERLAILMADASGHGMAAGLLMAITDTSLRIALDLDPDPGAVAGVLHGALRRTGDRRAFVTLFYGLLDLASGEIEFVSAGHPSPLVRRADGRVDEPASGSLPLGLGEAARPVRGRFALAPGDLLFLVTDGVFEAIGANGEAFGWERLRRTVAAATAGAQPAHEALRGALDSHVGREALSDDRTIVVLERASSVPPPPPPA